MSPAVRGFGDAVGVEDERVAGDEGTRHLLVARVAEAAEDDAGGDDLVAGFVVTKDRRRVAGGGGREDAGDRIDVDVRGGDELPFEAAEEERVEIREDARGR